MNVAIAGVTGLTIDMGNMQVATSLRTVCIQIPCKPLRGSNKGASVVTINLPTTLFNQVISTSFQNKMSKLNTLEVLGELHTVLARTLALEALETPEVKGEE